MFGRKDYYIVWSYYPGASAKYTEIVRARSLGAAWRKVRRERSVPICLREGRLL